VERDREDFHRQISGSDNLDYRGVIPPGEVPELLGEYDVLLLPTWHSGEGYPAVILQAFATGTAVIASRWLSIPDLIGEDHRGVLIPARDPEALRRAMDRLASDERFRRGIIENAHSYARRYSEKAIIGDILISDLLAEY
jgi:glycosyltransferase involved in cell wall biosynthesis